MTREGAVSGSGGSNQWVELLAAMNKQGGFPISLLTDQDGLLMAAATDDAERDAYSQAAVAATINQTAVQAHQQLGMSETTEIILGNAEGERLIYRPFAVNGQRFILVVLVVHRQQTYRMLTNNFIRAIKELQQF
jgi:predicted regulator of Ras-like GTPase activity (Roadblock/LC7/MglB family)